MTQMAHTVNCPIIASIDPEASKKALEMGHLWDIRKDPKVSKSGKSKHTKKSSIIVHKK